MRDWPSERLSWRDMWVIVRQAGPGSPIDRAARDSWQETLDTSLLRSVEYSLRVLRWHNTAAASTGQDVPEPIALPWDPAPEGTIAGDEMTWTEAMDFLGWERELIEGG